MEGILKQRTDTHRGYYFYTNNGKKWSVVDFQTTFAKAPDEVKYSGIFLGWEAIEVINEELQTETITRATSWEELKQLLK